MKKYVSVLRHPDPRLTAGMWGDQGVQNLMHKDIFHIGLRKQFYVKPVDLLLVNPLAMQTRRGLSYIRYHLLISYQCF